MVVKMELIEEKGIELIEKVFNEERKIIGKAQEEDIKVDEGIYSGGYVYIAENGEFIDLEIQTEDYDEESHIKYIEFAEEIYEKHHKKVSIYVLCAPDIKILIKPYPILSEAEFNIKLAQAKESLIDKIKNKMGH